MGEGRVYKSRMVLETLSPNIKSVLTSGVKNVPEAILEQAEMEMGATRSNMDVLIDEWMSTGNWVANIVMKMEGQLASMKGQKHTKQDKLIIAQIKKDLKEIRQYEILHKKAKIVNLTDAKEPFVLRLRDL